MAMSFAIAGALEPSTRLLSRTGSRRYTSTGIVLCLTSSIFAPVHSIRTGSHSRLPTCPLNKDNCPAPVAGLRAFHSSSHDWSSTPQFSYHVAASYSAKGHKFNAGANLFTGDVFDASKSNITDLKVCKSLKDRRTRAKSGQDSFFFSQVGNTRSTAFGVADGVGGWVDSGVDPSDFSHGLCEYMACAARAWPHGAKTTSLHPKDLLQVGYDEVMEDKNILGGGSTACLAVAEPDSNVEVANLGDSGFMHLGLNAVRHFTQPQTHAFNTPYQLSKTPKRMQVQMAVFGGTASLSDPPKGSNVSHHQVRHGDVLVFATDGVWDNLSPQDALGIVSRNMVDLGAWVERDGALEVSPELHKLVQADSDRKANSSSLQAKLSTAIAKEAKETSLNIQRDGPFAKEVQKHYPNERWRGGKPDDIAALVVVVVQGTAS